MLRRVAANLRPVVDREEDFQQFGGQMRAEILTELFLIN